MAASVYWLKFPCWPLPKASFRGFLFLPTSLALLTAVMIFFCFSSTSRLMINLHKNNDNHLDVNDVHTKQMIQISHPEPTRSSVLEFPNVSAKGDHEAADTTNDDDRTEGTQSQLPEEVPTAPKVEEDDDAPDTSVDNRREVAQSQLPEQSLAASIDDDASNDLDDRKEGVDSQFQEESLAGKIDDDAPNALDDRKEGVGSQFPEESLAGTIDDDAPDALDDKKEGVGSQFPKESLAGLIDDDGPDALDDRKEGDGSQFPEESLAGTIDDDAPNALDDKKGVGSQFPVESLAGTIDDDAPDALDDRKEGVGSEFPTESLAELMDDDAPDALDDRKEGIGSQFPEEILAGSIDDDGPDALDDRKEGESSQFPEESLAGTIDDDAPDALDDKKEGVGSQFPEESLASMIDDDASDALDDGKKGVGSQFREESLAVKVVGEARDDNRKEGTQSQSSEESSAFPIVEVDDEAPDALDNKREETQSQLTDESTDSPIGNSVDNDNEVYHDNYLFFENYKEMNRSLKIYVYPHSPHDRFANVLLPVTSEPGGSYGSECYFKKALMKSHFITKNPSKADFFFLPFSIASMRNDKRIGVRGMQDYVQDYVSNVRQKYPYWNRTGGADHFYVACHSIGKIAMVKAEEVKKNAIQVVCSSNYFVNGYVAHKDVSLPQIWPRNGNPPRVKPSKRKRLAFFAGASNSPPRQYLVKTWQNDSEIFAHAGRLKTPYEIEFLRSKFCFHVKGFEVNTTRIGDALYHGCVPVILADHYDLPFGDILNWKSFSVVVETSDIPLMKSILKGIGDEAYLRLHKNVEKVRKHFQWHGEPIEYDFFHIVMYELWLRRNYVRVPLS